MEIMASLVLGLDSKTLERTQQVLEEDIRNGAFWKWLTRIGGVFYILLGFCHRGVKVG